MTWIKKFSLLPPCIQPREELTAPRSETADEPFDAGFEDRMASMPMSTHRGIYHLPCGCNRCREYRAGYDFADKKRMTMLRKRKKEATK
jgi:hypothetical protein